MLQTSRWLPVFACSTVLLAACGDSDGDTDSGVLNKDAQTSGGDSGPGGSDGGVTGQDGSTPNPDGGTPAVCDPVTGGGCTAPEICIWVASIDMPQCRMPAATPIGHEQACNTMLHDCQQGFACIADPVNGGGICLKVCDNNDDADCAGLTGASMNGYSCLVPLSNNDPYSACGPTPVTCQPYNDTCPMGQYCEIVSATGDTGCIPEGTAMAGQNCGSATGGCMKGSFCLDLTNDMMENGICEEPCNPNGGACSNAGDTCNGLSINGQAATFGFCTTAPQGCLPFNPNDCPTGQNCEIIASDGTTGCITEGTAMAGQPCSQATGGCMKGSICLDVTNDMVDNGMCLTPCDPNNPMCAVGMCQGLSGPNGALPFGICQ